MSITSGARPLSQAPSSARLWRAGLVAAAAATLVNVLDHEEPGGTELVPLPLGRVLFHVLAAATMVGVARQQLARG